jgi:hypothetical protein
VLLVLRLCAAGPGVMEGYAGAGSIAGGEALLLARALAILQLLLESAEGKRLFLLYDGAPPVPSATFAVVGSPFEQISRGHQSVIGNELVPKCGIEHTGVQSLVSDGGGVWQAFRPCRCCCGRGTE